MWLFPSLVILLWMVRTIDGSASSGNSLENTFRQRSETDWQEVWHKEKHSRCRESLLQHLYWACEKDIYRLVRRSQWKPFGQQMENKLNYPWLTVSRAKEMLRSRRGSSSITSECCLSIGCTWEEYAEYCPTNKRYSPSIV